MRIKSKDRTLPLKLACFLALSMSVTQPWGQRLGHSGSTAIAAESAKPAITLDLPNIYPQRNLARLPLIDAARNKINLSIMPDNELICTVDKAPITVGDYRRQWILQERSLQKMLSTNDALVFKLSADAKKNGVVLTKAEEKEVTDQFKKLFSGHEREFAKALNEHQITANQFDELLLKTTLANKYARGFLEQELLPGLVDRVILCQAARKAGYEPAIKTKYLEQKKNHSFDALEKSGPLNAEQIRDQYIDDQLQVAMKTTISKLAKPVTEDNIEKYYNENKSKFQESEKIRFSQIIIAAPSIDIGGLKSLRHQVQSEHPHISEAGLAKAVTILTNKKKAKAEMLLKKATNGGDFAKLANENSDDALTKQTHNGGDLGYVNMDHFPKAVQEKIGSIKVREIYPAIIPSPYGYYIIKVTNRKPACMLALSMVKAQIERTLATKSQNDAYKTWIEEERAAKSIVLSAEFRVLVDADFKRGNIH